MSVHDLSPAVKYLVTVGLVQLEDELPFFSGRAAKPILENAVLFLEVQKPRQRRRILLLRNRIRAMKREKVAS